MQIWYGIDTAENEPEVQVLCIKYTCISCAEPRLTLRSQRKSQLRDLGPLPTPKLIGGLASRCTLMYFVMKYTEVNWFWSSLRVIWLSVPVEIICACMFLSLPVFLTESLECKKAFYCWTTWLRSLLRRQLRTSLVAVNFADLSMRAGTKCVSNGLYWMNATRTFWNNSRLLEQSRNCTRIPHMKKLIFCWGPSRKNGNVCT